MSKKIWIGIIVLSTILFIARQFYTISNPYLKQKAWLHGGGYHFSDGFTFGKEDDIINDTLFFNKKPVALIIKRGYRPFIPNYLVIKSLKTNKIGTYHEK